ncbi:phosphoesterase [candidate division KSB1 bacterium]|nr:phosphoesterase [candidate division KSB1 bacterium]
MANKKNKNENKHIEIMSELDKQLEGQKRLLIVLHNNPDPDAIASAYCLRFLTEKRYGLVANIAYDGLIGRAENRALVREVKIPLKNINRIKYGTYDRVAMIDTQPGAGNNVLPENVHCHIIIDHHPQRKGLESEVILVDTEVGASATLLIEILMQTKLSMSSDMATALSFAIKTETQDLGRETSERDIDAYFKAYSRASMRKLARISMPKLPHSYFVTLDKMLKRTRIFRHLICAHLGDVPTPEIVAEMADFLLRHERMGWAFCTGRFKENLYISMRASSNKANAGKLIKDLVPDRNLAGGHGMFAGGTIPLKKMPSEEISILEIRLNQKFAKLMGHDDPDWKPLLEDSRVIRSA